jgi:pSer/pThr/pTyr-binding forkhead associated (FHA) protein
MEPTPATPAADCAASPSSQAELVIQNGRMRGTCRQLNHPLTLIGRKTGCDIRLNVEGVSARHCVLLLHPTGVMLRNLQSEEKTLVNEKPVTVCALRNGDQLTIGPFQFQLRLPADLPAIDVERQVRIDQELDRIRRESDAQLHQEKERLRAEMAAQLGPERDALRNQTQALAAQQTSLASEETRLQQRWLALDQHSEQVQAKIRQEKDALRVQAAAVVAQQAALTEEEIRLQQRRVALQQQEEQLSAHLGEKQRRLAELKEQTRASRVALQNERAAYETRVAESVRQLNQGRKENEDGA